MPSAEPFSRCISIKSTYHHVIRSQCHGLTSLHTDHPPREGRGLLDAGCERFCCSTAQVTAVLSRAQNGTDSSAAAALVASKSVIFVSLPM